MRRTAMIAAVLSVGMLTACQTQEAPSPPPTSQPALTTATPEPAPTTEAAPATEATPTTAEPVATTTEPEAVMDQSEEGAEAFVEHYISTLNAVHLRQAEVKELRALAKNSCKTCQGFADAADSVIFDRDYIRHVSSKPLLIGDDARVESRILQVEGEKEIDSVFTLEWDEDQWLVAEIQLAG